MKNNPELSIIIVSYNVRELLLNCIKSIIDTAADLDYEIIVVDNASNDNSALAVKETYPQVQIIANKENIGFAAANNQGYAVSKGDFLLLLNPDTLIRPNAIKAVLEFMKETPDAGMAGCRLLNPDGALQKSIRYFPTVRENLLQVLFLNWIVFRHYWLRTYYSVKSFVIDYCAGAFMMVRREAVGNMQLLDTEFFMYAEEKDLALRLKRTGWNTYFVPFGEIIHFGGQSTGRMAKDMFIELQRSQVKFFEKHYSVAYSWALALTWWLVLISNFVISLPLALLAKGRQRLSLFAGAVTQYPQILRHILM